MIPTDLQKEIDDYVCEIQRIERIGLRISQAAWSDLDTWRDDLMTRSAAALGYALTADDWEDLTQ